MWFSIRPLLTSHHRRLRYIHDALWLPRLTRHSPLLHQQSFVMRVRTSTRVTGPGTCALITTSLMGRLCADDLSPNSQCLSWSTNKLRPRPTTHQSRHRRDTKSWQRSAECSQSWHSGYTPQSQCCGVHWIMSCKGSIPEAVKYVSILWSQCPRRPIKQQLPLQH